MRILLRDLSYELLYTEVAVEDKSNIEMNRVSYRFSRTVLGSPGGTSSWRYQYFLSDRSVHNSVQVDQFNLDRSIDLPSGRMSIWW